jgi:DNA modification methylase
MNRLILGDSLLVMASLAERENLAGQVQMIYFDPPYGIKFASNFQPELGKRDVKDQDADLSREPEVVKAYRDTWTLGVHSYLTYLRARLLAAHRLLKPRRAASLCRSAMRMCTGCGRCWMRYLGRRISSSRWLSSALAR